MLEINLSISLLDSLRFCGWSFFGVSFPFSLLWRLLLWSYIEITPLPLQIVRIIQLVTRCIEYAFPAEGIVLPINPVFSLKAFCVGLILKGQERPKRPKYLSILWELHFLEIVVSETRSAIFGRLGSWGTFPRIAKRRKLSKLTFGSVLNHI